MYNLCKCVVYNIILPTVLARPKPPLHDDSDVTSAPTPQATPLPTVASTEATTKHSPPVGLCALPSNPQEDTSMNKNGGYRFGMWILIFNITYLLFNISVLFFRKHGGK